MRYAYLSLMLFIFNFVEAMELPCNKMLSLCLSLKIDEEIFQNSLPQELQQKVITYIRDKKEWWYLDKTFQHAGAIASVCFNSTGTQLATGSRDKQAQIFDLVTHEKIVSFQHDDCVRSVCFSPDDNQLATGSAGKKARIFDLASNKRIALFHYDRCINSVRFNSTGTQLATGLAGGKAQIFDLVNNK